MVYKRVVLTGEKAIVFYNNAVEELTDKKETTEFVNQKVGGWWKEGDSFVAFDNHTNELFVDEFPHEELAVKYANGVVPFQKGGVII